MLIEIHLPDDWTAVADPAGLRTEIDAAMSTLGQARLRLTTLIDTPAAVEQISATYLDARDGTPPDTGQARDWPAYRQPTGAHDAYPAGRVIRWTDGRLYRAVRLGVAHSPAEYPADWTDVTDKLTGVDPPEAPVVTADPWSPDMAYAAGVEVSFGGHTYRSKVPIAAGQYGAMTPDNPVLWAVWELVA